MYKIFKVNKTALNNGWDWDFIIENNALDIVTEFNSYDNAVNYFETNNLDPDMYCIC